MENPEDLKAKKVELLVFTKGSAFVYVSELVRDLESVGCQVRDSQFMFLTEDDVAKHYAHVVGRPFYPEIERLFKEHPVFIMKVYGTVENVKSVVGKETNPLSCETFSFRGQHGNDMTDNACHRSSSEEDAEKEVDLFFGDNGIVTKYRQNPVAQLEFYDRMVDYVLNAPGF
ncbi:hypothetical protein II582_03240 [bacterium]|nr:hypothetical protein [bacterium]